MPLHIRLCRVPGVHAPLVPLQLTSLTLKSQIFAQNGQQELRNHIKSTRYHEILAPYTWEQCIFADLDTHFSAAHKRVPSIMGAQNVASLQLYEIF